MKPKFWIAISVGLVLIYSCGDNTASKHTTADSAAVKNDTVSNSGTSLPPPYATKSVRNSSKVIAWPEGKMPVAPQGFVVTKFADSLDHPRWIYVADNGDVFVAQAGREKSGGPNNILLLRDKNKDGVPESKFEFLSNLNQPFGMLILGNKFYVANTDAVVQYDYTSGATSVKGPGKPIVSLPGGPRHWTRNIISNAKGDKIFIAIGSGSNVAEKGIDKEIRRANILEINPGGSGERVYASGLRNPVGMDWAPGTNVLWTAVNERDELGDDLVPDYMTEVKDGGFYGWPYSYFGQHLDPRMEDQQRPDLVQKAIVPDVPLGSHTASLGLAFYTKKSFPEKYWNGAFIGQHGSWNRSQLVGYKVAFVPFKNGKPAGAMEDFLTGFIADADKTEVYGRPVGVATMADGSLLVADDGSNTIWRVSYNK